MTRAKIIALSCGAAFIVASAAFWFGMREGLQLGMMLDSMGRGSVAALLLRDLDAGKPVDVRMPLELDVDMALIWAYHVDEHPLRPLFEPVWGRPMHLHAEALPRIASYRKAMPSPLRAEPLAKEPVVGDRIIETMIQRYSHQQ